MAKSRTNHSLHQETFHFKVTFKIISAGTFHNDFNPGFLRKLFLQANRMGLKITFVLYSDLPTLSQSRNHFFIGVAFYFNRVDSQDVIPLLDLLNEFSIV